MAKIMLADDEPSMQNLIRRIVLDGGYEFCSAFDGEDAIGVYEREHPDLVMLDVMMPKLDGFQVCRELRSKGAIVPIVFLTAKGDIADKGVGFSVGGDDFCLLLFQLCRVPAFAEVKYFLNSTRVLRLKNVGSSTVNKNDLVFFQHNSVS